MQAVDPRALRGLRLIGPAYRRDPDFHAVCRLRTAGPPKAATKTIRSRLTGVATARRHHGVDGLPTLARQARAQLPDRRLERPGRCAQSHRLQRRSAPWRKRCSVRSGGSHEDMVRRSHANTERQRNPSNAVACATDLDIAIQTRFSETGERRSVMRGESGQLGRTMRQGTRA